jgi:hypothetical protein
MSRTIVFPWVLVDEVTVCQASWRFLKVNGGKDGKWDHPRSDRPPCKGRLNARRAGFGRRGPL